MIEKAVTKATNQIKEEYEKEVKSSKDMIYQSKICNLRKVSEKAKGGQKGHMEHKLEKFEKDEVIEICPHVKIVCLNCLSID